MKRISMGVLVLAAFLFSGSSFAKSAYLKAFKEAYPNATAIAKCAVCHEKTPKLNYYGMDYEKANRDFKVIEALDSDGDGVTNIDEINNGTQPGVKE